MSGANQSPEAIIGATSVKALRLAGFDIVERPKPKRYVLTCPHCGAQGIGRTIDFYLNWGEAWHRPCVPFERSWPSRRNGLLPMILSTASEETAP